MAYRKAAEFFFWACLFSWGLAGAWLVLGVDLQSTTGLILAIAYMFGPMVAAVTADRGTGRTFRETVGLDWRFNRWLIVGWLLPVVMAFLGLGFGLLMPGASYSPEMQGMYERFSALLSPDDVDALKAQVEAMPVHPIWLALLQGLIAGATVNAVAGFGEEAGWRGFLLRELSGLGFWRSSLLVGLLWGLWHAPLILQGHNYPDHPVLGVVFMTITTVLISPVISYVTLKARTVLAAAIMHGTFNAVFVISIMVVAGGSDLTVGMTGLAGFITLSTLIVGLVSYDRWIASEPIGDMLDSYRTSPV